MIGKLKHSLKEKCPECGSVLQLRVMNIKTIEQGIPIYIPEEYIGCSNKNCEYKRKMEQKRRRRQADI